MIKKALIVLLSFGVSIAACEVMARLCFDYKAPWYEQLIGEQAKVDMYGFRSNSMGLRDREFENYKYPSCRRVFMLGDSFTWGWGVESEDATFPKIIEAMLNKSSKPDGVERVEILNGGIPGSLTGQWVDLLEKYGDDFKPDIVLVVFFLRDGTNVLSIDDFFNPIRRNIVESNRSSILYRNLLVYRLACDYYNRHMVSMAYTRAINQSYLGDEDEIIEWVNAKKNLLRIKQYADERSAVMGLIVFPVLVNLHDEYPFEQVCNTIIDFAHENAIPVHSLLPAFWGLDAGELWVSAYDQHPNERAHRIAAESMLPFVRSLFGELEKKRSE